MGAEGLLLAFLYLALRIAIILIVAYALVWLANLFGLSIDPMVYKFGKIIVAIIIAIVVVIFLFDILGSVSLFSRSSR